MKVNQGKVLDTYPVAITCPLGLNVQDRGFVVSDIHSGFMESLWKSQIRKYLKYTIQIIEQTELTQLLKIRCNKQHHTYNLYHKNIMNVVGSTKLVTQTHNFLLFFRNNTNTLNLLTVRFGLKVLFCSCYKLTSSVKVCY